MERRRSISENLLTDINEEEPEYVKNCKETQRSIGIFINPELSKDNRIQFLFNGVTEEPYIQWWIYQNGKKEAIKTGVIYTNIDLNEVCNGDYNILGAGIFMFLKNVNDSEAFLKFIIKRLDLNLNVVHNGLDIFSLSIDLSRTICPDCRDLNSRRSVLKIYRLLESHGFNVNTKLRGEKTAREWVEAMKIFLKHSR